MKTVLGPADSLYAFSKFAVRCHWILTLLTETFIITNIDMDAYQHKPKNVEYFFNHFKSSLASSCKIARLHILVPSSSSPRDRPSRKVTPENRQTIIYSNIICNSKNIRWRLYGVEGIFFNRKIDAIYLNLSP